MIRPITNIYQPAGPILPIRLVLPFVITGMLFFSCQSDNRKNLQPGKTDSLNYKLPQLKSISPEENDMIRNACERWYDSAMKPSGFNGGILIAKKGNIIFERYQGSGHLNGPDLINENTPTHIASVSKTFTAMCVLKIVQEGKAGLDDEFSRFFPGFNYPGVTIRNMLNHRSGLPNYLYFMDELGWDKKKNMKNQDVYDYLVNRKAEIKNISSPNTHFTYCNTNYALLALLIEKISGMPYPQYIKKTIFEPLQMNSSFVYTPSDSGRVNPSYDWRGGLIPMNALDPVYGDKNIYTTPRDLLKWDRVLRTDLFISPALLEQAYTPYSNEKPGIRNYGLGWRMNVYPGGKKIIYHNGWWHGNNASFLRLIDEDITIIAMGNRFCRCIYKVKNLLNMFYPAFQQVTDEENESGNPKPESSE